MGRRAGGLDVEAELVRLYRMLMEDVERLRRYEAETGEVVVNKYLYYDQANRVLGQIILLRYKYNADVEDPWEELRRLVAGDPGSRERERAGGEARVGRE